MKKRLKLYLAHPLDSRKQLREWELEIEKRLDIEIINPFYDTNRQDVEMIDSGRKKRYEKLDESKIVQRDVAEIAKSDGIIAMVTGDISYGTIQEMVYANILQKKVYSIITNGHENHPWLKYHSDEIFLNKKDFEEYLICRRGMSDEPGSPCY